jgi:hypothetical protein
MCVNVHGMKMLIVANHMKDMVGTRRLELLTSTVSR